MHLDVGLMAFVSKWFGALAMAWLDAGVCHVIIMTPCHLSSAITSMPYDPA